MLCNMEAPKVDLVLISHAFLVEEQKAMHMGGCYFLLSLGNPSWSSGFHSTTVTWARKMLLTTTDEMVRGTWHGDRDGAWPLVERSGNTSAAGEGTCTSLHNRNTAL